jgi:hypothetical protein
MAFDPTAPEHRSDADTDGLAGLMREFGLLGWPSLGLLSLAGQQRWDTEADGWSSCLTLGLIALRAQEGERQVDAFDVTLVPATPGNRRKSLLTKDLVAAAGSRAALVEVIFEGCGSSGRTLPPWSADG